MHSRHLDRDRGIVWAWAGEWGKAEAAGFDATNARRGQSGCRDPNSQSKEQLALQQVA